MRNIFKLLLSTEPRLDRSDVRAWAMRFAERLPGCERIELDLVDPEAHTIHNKSKPDAVKFPTVGAVVSLWCESAAPEPPPGYDMTVLRVRERIGYGFEDDAIGPVDGYKKLALWKARADVPAEEWDALYARHIVTVPALQPIWRYRQNIILDAPADCPYDAMSENWWRTLHDLDAGFYRSDAAEASVMAEVSAFIDRDMTTNLVTRNELLHRR